MAAAPVDSLPTPRWFLVTDSSPDSSQLPVTVVKSRSRDRAVWTPGVHHDSSDPAFRQSVSTFFEQGEHVYAEDWFPPLA